MKTQKRIFLVEFSIPVGREFETYKYATKAFIAETSTEAFEKGKKFLEEKNEYSDGVQMSCTILSEVEGHTVHLIEPKVVGIEPDSDLDITLADIVLAVKNGEEIIALDENRPLVISGVVGFHSAIGFNFSANYIDTDLVANRGFFYEDYNKKWTFKK